MVQTATSRRYSLPAARQLVAQGKDALLQRSSDELSRVLNRVLQSSLMPAPQRALLRKNLIAAVETATAEQPQHREALMREALANAILGYADPQMQLGPGAGMTVPQLEQAFLSMPVKPLYATVDRRAYLQSLRNPDAHVQRMMLTSAIKEMAQAGAQVLKGPTQANATRLAFSPPMDVSPVLADKIRVAESAFLTMAVKPEYQELPRKVVVDTMTRQPALRLQYLATTIQAWAVDPEAAFRAAGISGAERLPLALRDPAGQRPIGES